MMEYCDACSTQLSGDDRAVAEFAWVGEGQGGYCGNALSCRVLRENRGLLNTRGGLACSLSQDAFLTVF
jgi:hypothetical protein